METQARATTRGGGRHLTVCGRQHLRRFMSLNWITANLENLKQMLNIAQMFTQQRL